MTVSAFVFEMFEINYTVLLLLLQHVFQVYVAWERNGSWKQFPPSFPLNYVPRITVASLWE
jgi:hypothetical protein